MTQRYKLLLAPQKKVQWNTSASGSWSKQRLLRRNVMACRQRFVQTCGVPRSILRSTLSFPERTELRRRTLRVESGRNLLHFVVRGEAVRNVLLALLYLELQLSSQHQYLRKYYRIAHDESKKGISTQNHKRHFTQAYLAS